MFELIIFDCDGVLVDSEPLSNRIFADTLRDFGFDTNFQWCVDTLVGLSLSSCYQKIENHFGRPVPAEFETELRQRSFIGFRENLEPVPGIKEVVRNLSTPYCVASSGPMEKMRVTLGVTGLWPLFEGRIFSASEVERGKPYPDLFLHAAKNMAVDPGRCAVVEDSPYGVEAAQAAGMAAFGYVGGEIKHDLAAAGAQTFRKMAQLPEVLGLT